MFCRVIEIMPDEELQKGFKKIVREFLGMEPSIKVAIYPEFLRLMSRIPFKESEIEKFVKLIPEITSFEKYVESLPHLLNIFGGHPDKNKKKKLIMKTFDHLNSEMNSNISSADRFNKLDKLFQKMIDSKTDLTELLTFEPFLNLLHYPKKSTKMKLLVGVLDGLTGSEFQILKDPIIAYTILELCRSLTNDRLFAKESDSVSNLEKKFQGKKIADS